MTLLEEAADLGHSIAQVNLSFEFHPSEKEDSQRKAVYYSTLAASQGIHDGAYCRLGDLFLEGFGGLVKSDYLAKHYFELGAKHSAIRPQESAGDHARMMSN